MLRRVYIHANFQAARPRNHSTGPLTLIAIIETFMHLRIKGNAMNVTIQNVTEHKILSQERIITETTSGITTKRISARQNEQRKRIDRSGNEPKRRG